MEQQREIDIDLLQPGRYQPRRRFDGDSLAEMAESIRQNGLIQPVVVRRLPDSTRYEILAGERRWRAAALVPLHKVPCIVRDDITDEQAALISLTENIQRRDLTPIEEAMSFQRLATEFHMEQAAIAEGVGKSRAYVSNMIRLLTLDPEVQAHLDDPGSSFTVGHAKALITLPAKSQLMLLRCVVERGWTVREVEAKAKELTAFFNGQPAPGAGPKKSANARALENRLSEFFCAPVDIQYDDSGKGRMVLSFNSADEFNGVLAKLKGYKDIP